MSKPAKTVYLAIHGHFYQPPRENPWTEQIELQPDAKPFHNWNERILVQCYQPNAMARIVDGGGRVLEIVNNFRLFSFNVGPTLLNWLEKHAPVVYHRILEGDRVSVREHSGHGNALAQVYNHMILPLGREADQRTQIRWGVEEFKHRFGREPEGIWLPETAASERTLEILIEEGLRFTILAPEQAEAVRPLHAAALGGPAKPSPQSSWHDVSQGMIDPTRPYRFFHSKQPGRWIDLFFFDGPLSRDASFTDLLFDAGKLVHRLKECRRAERHHPELIHLACDGETFGHHKAYGERVVAFILQEEAERQGMKRVNYGEYLEKFPPQFEIKLKEGEGTSWSCVHGVGRWKEDCGCHTGGGPGWNQKWRAPLREAVRFLGESLAGLYEKEGRALLKNPWAARDRYIELILDRSEAAREKFFKENAPHPLALPDQIRALKLLEMERYAMLCETSCGWFFSDLAGIETVQILRYALRALELASEFGGGGTEKEFLEKLAPAKSNRPEAGDGRAVWEKQVKSGRVSWEKLVCHFAFRKLFELETPARDFYHCEVTEGETEREREGDLTLLMGAVRLKGKTLPESQDFIYAVLQEGSASIHCFVKRSSGPGELHKYDIAPLSFLRKREKAPLLESLQRSFGQGSFSLKDLFPEERDQILRILSRGMREDLFRMASRFYDQSRSDMTVFRGAAHPLPEEFRELMEWTMGERLFEIVQQLDRRISFEKIKERGRALLTEAEGAGVSVRVEPTVEFLSRRLNDWIEKLFHEPEVRLVPKIEEVLDLARSLGILLQERIAQDLFFAFAQKVLREWIEAHHTDPGNEERLRMIQSVIRLGDQLGFNMGRYESQLKQKAGAR